MRFLFGCILLGHLFILGLAGHEPRAAPADSRGGFCTCWAASATMGDAVRLGSLSNDVLRVQRTKGSAFAIIIDEVMTQTFGQLGSGSGLTRRVGRGASTQALPHRLSGWLAVAKWCGVAVCEALSTLSVAVRAIAPAFSTSGTTWAIAHCPRRCRLIALRATRRGSPLQARLPLLHSKQPPVTKQAT